MNIEITAEYNGIRFPVIIGQEYEFKIVNNWIKGKLLSVRFSKHDNSYSFDSDKEIYAGVPTIRPVQKPVARQLTHKEIAMNLVGKGVFKLDVGYWKTEWSKDLKIKRFNFCFFADLDEPSEKWHKLDTDLLDMIKERE
jgi:hypothetical protein